MSDARADFTATLLHDGRVLVAGGTSGAGILASAELFDPRTGSWFGAAAMSTPRASHTATLLNDGRVLLVGGFGPGGPLSGAELYDPITNSWHPTEALQIARSNHTATLRKDGKVLVVGGFGTLGALNSVELYDPISGRWVGFVPLPPVAHARYAHAAALLPDGRILVAGGFDSSGPLRSAELYDPKTDFWSLARDMLTPRALHTATLLSSGRVLVTGGRVPSSGTSIYTNSAELYDPNSDTWSSAGTMIVPREAHTATLLSSGQVLIAGGSAGGDLDSAEMYTPAQAPAAAATATSSPTATPIRSQPTSTPTAVLPPPPPPSLVPTPTTVPTGPTAHILGVRVEKYGTKPDWQQVRSPLKRAAVGTRVRLSIYVGFTAVTRQTHVVVTMAVRHAGRVVYKVGLTEDRSGDGDLWGHWNFTPQQPGSYVVTGNVRSDGFIQSAITSFRAVQLPVLFTFDRLQTLNEKGLPTHRFARTDRVILAATFTVQHATGTVPVTIGQSLRYSTAHGWKPLGRRVQNSFVTTNGTHPYTVSFVPQSPYSLLRMTIDITIGSNTQRKAVTFEVHG